MLSQPKKIWQLFTHEERRKACWMLLLVFLMALAETAGVVSIMPFLSVLSRPAVIHELPWLDALYTRLGFAEYRPFIQLLGLVSIVLVVGSSMFKTLTLHVLNRFVHLQRHSLSTRLLSRYLHQPYEFFLTRNPSVLAKNVLSEVDQLVFDLIQPLSQLLAQGVLVAAMVALIVYYDPVTAACVVGVLGLLYGSIYGLARKHLARIGRERQAADAQRYQACNEALGGIKDVQVNQVAPAYLAKFEAASRLFSRHMAANETLNQSPLYLVEATGYSGLILIALVLLRRTDDIAHLLPALGLYGFAAYRMLPSAQIMYRGFARLRFASAAIENMVNDFDLPEPPPPPPMPPLVPQREIRLQGIRYAYPSTPDKPVLDNFDLVIPAGSSLAIVGRSGAGKSTLMDILLGILSPQVGTLSVDGVPITAANLPAWQRAIGYVPQHIYLADMSVTENIAFGVPRQEIDMAAVERAARIAQIHDFVVNELPNGYDTLVGDRGIRLSGGQRQRIGIARALYRDPPVLLMDEATSALDGKTEGVMNKTLSNFFGKRTILSIAHRNDSLHYCQQIVSINAPEATIETKQIDFFMIKAVQCIRNEEN